MKNIVTSASIIFLILISSCKKDNDSSNNNLPGPSITVTVRIVGTVVDENGNGISGVSLNVGNAQRGTDASGFFVFESVTVPASRYYVSAVKNGYFESGFGGIPKNGTVHNVKITLSSLGTPFNVGSNGSTLNITGGAKITFPANAFETGNGIPMVGTASVYVKHLSPGSTTFAQLVPGGDLANLSSNGSISPLKTYGMIGVEIHDQGGMKLRLAVGKTAEVKLPIASSQLSTAPINIPLLSFDSKNGVWKKEGMAVKTGNEYIGTVSHFSWWNCDVISVPPAPIIIGKVLDCNGVPMPGIVVTINSVFNVITNSQGVYSGWVPQGIAITAQVMSIMNNGIVPNSPIVSLPPLSSGNFPLPDIITSCPTYCSGSVENCNGIPISFYVWASWTNGSSNAIYSGGSSFQIPIPSNTNVTLHISNGQFLKDTAIISGAIGINNNIGAFILCNTTGAITGCSGGPNKIFDIDGNMYNVVQIGNQCWMKENLKTSRYRNGDTIEYIPREPIVDDSIWHSRTTGAYTTIDNTIYGKLYNWYTTADPRNVCPSGWHVPDSSEFLEMSLFLGGDNIAGGPLKQTGISQSGTGLWFSPNTGATNSSGFTGLPAGARQGGTGGNGGFTFLWCATQGNASSGWIRRLSQDNAIFAPAGLVKSAGASIRCVKD